MTSPRRRIDATRERVRQSLLRGIEAVEAVLVSNRKLAESPTHRESAEQRIREGEYELARLQAELAALEEELASDRMARHTAPPEDGT